MMPAPAPPMLPPKVMAEAAMLGAPPEVIYRYCYNQWEYFCRMCRAYATEDHLRSRCHLRRLPDWRYWVWHNEQLEILGVVDLPTGLENNEQLEMRATGQPA